MRTLVLIVALIGALLVATTAFAGVRDNDDTCDIKVGPAATLLLPYFEVDIFGNSGLTTLFTITNVTRYPQIAHVTLWTDFAFPVLTFNLYLTGYGVQSIDLADVINRGVVAAPNAGGARGSLSSSSNDQLRSDNGCDSLFRIPANVVAAVESALTSGRYFGAGLPTCTEVGGVHAHAIGYVTVDVVSNCTSRFPSDPLYYSNDLLYDNVLIGDYQQIGPVPTGTSSLTRFEAGGNPMVHIRAVPEGGTAGAEVATNLPYTFYDRYTPKGARTIDRRQPLPSTFAARYVQGSPAAFATNFTIWREGFGSGTCASAGADAVLVVPEMVGFDEHENSFILVPSDHNPFVTSPPSLPATSSTASVNVSLYPILKSSDVGGWMFFNLNNGGSTSYSVTKGVGGPSNVAGGLAPAGATTTIGPRPSQNWVTVTMFGTLGANRMAAEFDAAPLGNGCSPAAFLSTANSKTGQPIGPAGGVFVCPPGPTLTNGTTTQCTGTNANPPP